ncbi:MAG: aminodeoxychorismate lyase [Gammaproteobacteria bacterium]|nr:aminodeoxychorismate lyase [Gammaproteobacteria bacterium]
MPLPVHWVNQQPDSSLSTLDRGFAYGDGVFETLRCHRGRFHLLEQHLQRLQLGCERLEIPCPHESLRLHLHDASNYLRSQELADATLRLTVTRGSALENECGRGYAGAHGAPNVVLSLYSARLPWRAAPPPLHLICHRTPLATQPLLAGIKHCNRLEQVLAAKAVQRVGADEAIMLNQAGRPVSAVAANLFLVIGNNLYTPDLSECGVAGTVRGVILEHLADACMIHVEQRALELEELYQAQELILSNSLVGIQSVASVESQHFSTTRVADKLRSCFFDWVDAQAQ